MSVPRCASITFPGFRMSKRDNKEGQRSKSGAKLGSVPMDPRERAGGVVNRYAHWPRLCVLPSCMDCNV